MQQKSLIKLKAKTGQASVEWIIMGSFFALLWLGSMQMATRLLHRTMVQTWALFSSRQALSHPNQIPKGLLISKMKTRKHSSAQKGTAEVSYHHSRSAHEIKVPNSRRMNGGLLDFTSWLALYQSLLF